MKYLCEDCEIIVPDSDVCDNCGEKNIINVYTDKDVESIRLSMLQRLKSLWMRNKSLNKKQIENFAQSYGIKV